MVTNNIGSVARGEDCFGRNELVNLIWDKLETGHILLVAPRRFGKTSIMYCLLDNPKTRFKLIRMDVEYFQEPSELISEMLIKISKLTSFGKIVEGVSTLPGKILSKVRDNISEVDLYKIKIKLKDENMKKHWKIIGEEIFHNSPANY